MVWHGGTHLQSRLSGGRAKRTPQVQGLSGLHSKLGTSPAFQFCIVQTCFHINKIKCNSEWNDQNGHLRKEVSDLIHLPKHIQNAINAKTILEIILIAKYLKISSLMAKG